MTVEERTCEEVERRLHRLEAEHGEFPVVEETVANDPEYYAHGVELATSGWIGDAGAWITDAEGRALLIRHEADSDRWGTPGGGHEPGETLVETARREVREETGVAVRLTDIYRARRKTVVDESDPGRHFQMLTVWFEGEPVESNAEIDVSDEEIVEARWHATPPKRVHDFLDAKMDAWDGTSEES